MHLRDEPPDVGGARAWLHAARLELGAAVRDVADILLQAYLAANIQVIVLHLSRSHLGVWFDDIVHDKFLKQRLCGSVRSQIFIFLLFPLLASLLALLLFLTNFTLFPFVSFHSLKK